MPLEVHARAMCGRYFDPRAGPEVDRVQNTDGANASREYRHFPREGRRQHPAQLVDMYNACGVRCRRRSKRRNCQDSQRCLRDQQDTFVIPVRDAHFGTPQHAADRGNATFIGEEC